MVLTILLAARHKRAHPALTPAGEGWYSIYLPRRDGRLSWPRCLIKRRPGIEPMTAGSEVRRPNHCAIHVGTCWKIQDRRGFCVSEQECTSCNLEEIVADTLRCLQVTRQHLLLSHQLGLLLLMHRITHNISSWCILILIRPSSWRVILPAKQFLADRTNCRAYATVLRLSVVVCLSVTLCIVAKRCVLEQKLLLTASMKSCMGNRLIPKWMTLTFV